MFLALILSALADSITLDTGVTIEGDLARYEFGGDCQISVTEGELRGVILIVPCHRVEAFVRTTPALPTPIGLTSVAPTAARELEPTRSAGPTVAREVAPTSAATPSPAVAEADPGPVAETVPLAGAAPIEESEPLPTAAVPLGAPRPAPVMGDVDDESPPDAETARRAVSF